VVTIRPASGGAPLAKYNGGKDLADWTRRWDEHIMHRNGELPGEGLFMLRKVTGA
jgi:hypothetical protein